VEDIDFAALPYPAPIAEGAVSMTYRSADDAFIIRPGERRNGSFDLDIHECVRRSSGCIVRDTPSFRVKAKALVPGVLYAYRATSRAGEESIELIAPPSIWYGAMPLEKPEATLDMTHLSLPLNRGSSCSATFNVLEDALDHFVTATRGEGSQRADGPDDVGFRFPIRAFGTGQITYAFSVEIIWQSTETEPRITAFISSV
jgi:hypothetical protein